MIDIKEVKAKLDIMLKNMKKESSKKSEEQTLKDKYDRYKLQKLINGLKPYCRTDKIRSNGNGL